MSLSIALAGKPNTGKSTFFKAATLVNVEIANYPFTTISANRGTSRVRVPCPCTQLEARCGHCVGGVRFVPIELVDVAGLVPEAHKGRGLGNAFLDNLRQSEAIINVIDASGGTDIEGNVLGAPSHDPLEDITLLESEISLWIAGIIEKELAQTRQESAARAQHCARGRYSASRTQHRGTSNQKCLVEARAFRQVARELGTRGYSKLVATSENDRKTHGGSSKQKRRRFVAQSLRGSRTCAKTPWQQAARRNLRFDLLSRRDS